MQRIALFIVTTLSLLLATQATPISAAAPSSTFIVNSAGNASDANIGNGVCATSSGVCTLRAAIQEANDDSDHDTIRFAQAIGTLTPSTPLPTIERPLTIDGVSGNSSSCPSGGQPATLLVTLSGASISTADTHGLDLNDDADGSTILGLNIVDWTGAGINLAGRDRSGNDDYLENVTVRCNHIGTDNGNSVTRGNRFGILATGVEGLMIGGLSTSNRNVISGNDSSGVELFRAQGFPSDNNPPGFSAELYNNYIGTSIQGTAPLGNGTGVATVAFGVPDSGYLLNATIGTASDPNIIAYNDGNGVWVGSDVVGSVPKRVAVRGNSIYQNGLMGVDAGGPGVTAADSGSNRNAPQILDISDSNLVSARLTSLVAGFPFSYSIDVYASEQCDGPVAGLDNSASGSGHGEGQTYLGSIVIMPNQTNFDFTYQLPALPPNTTAITMMSTNFSGQSSDFSNCAFVGEVGFTVDTRIAAPDPTPGDFACNIITIGNRCSFDAAVDEINALVGYGPFRISFNIDDFDPNEQPFQMDGSALEIIRKQVIIDGRTQPGTQCQGVSGTSNTLLKLPTQLRLDTGSDGSIVRGLNINAGPGDRIQIFSDDNRLDCLSLIGPSGLDDGIDLGGNDNVIGGSADWQRNFIRGFDDDGIVLSAGASGNIIYNTELLDNGTGIAVFSGATDNHFGARMEMVDGELVEIGRNSILFSEGDGIILDGSGGGNYVGGNDIGVQDGSSTGGNTGVGIRVLSNSNVIGKTRGHNGLLYDLPNVIGNNTVTGIHVEAANTHIVGNLIGFASNGISDRGNTLNGIFVAAGSSGTLIENNTIGHNGAHGISLRAGSTDIFGNRIGVAVNGSAAGNGFNGILVDGSSVDVGRVGDLSKGNTILHNGQDGVYLDANADVVDVAGNTIAGNGDSGIGVHPSAMRGFFVQNSFIENGGLAIDLNNDGEQTENDQGDEDTGANGLVNTVVLLDASDNGTVTFQFNGAPNTLHLVEFYKSEQCDDNDYGEGFEALEDRLTFTTDGDGNFCQSSQRL